MDTHINVNHELISRLIDTNHEIIAYRDMLKTTSTGEDEWTFINERISQIEQSLRSFAVKKIESEGLDSLKQFINNQM